MVASLDGIIFDQFYGDNSGGDEFDTDGDGRATQEDEFVSISNSSREAVDLSGWEIWSDMTGVGAPDGPQDGLYHRFPSGSVLKPGETLYIVNEISGRAAYNMQEASEGGLESGDGDVNTNFLSEGAADSDQPESIVLLNPETGEYIVLNFSATEPSGVPDQSGFKGTKLVGESNAATDSGVEDQNAGSSYKYNARTDSYEYGAVAVPCFAAGTLISAPDGSRAVEDLRPGGLVLTLDHGAQPLLKVLIRRLDLTKSQAASHKPIEFKAGALGPCVPDRPLVVSPQHRMMVRLPSGTDCLVPAKALLDWPGVRVMAGRRFVTYVHLVFARHEIVEAHGCWSESFFPGPHILTGCPLRIRQDLGEIFSDPANPGANLPARPVLNVREARAALGAWRADSASADGLWGVSGSDAAING